MPPATPSTFTSSDHTYVARRELGQGGQGRTLLVEREGEPGPRLVLKLLRLEHVDDWKQVELFEREVATLAALDHPGIPRLVDRIVEDERTAGIVQTYVEGHTVAQQIAEHGPLSAERFEQILREGLEILAYLHEQVPPVLHRDINPRNVMLGPARVSLIDFGAVRVGGKTDMTSVGTFGYMPPEQIIGRAVPASDMYGLGMTLVSLAERRDVGDLPHDASSGQVDASRLLRGVSPRVRDVVLAMIKPGLGERLADPREALRRLDVPPPVPAVVAMSDSALVRPPRGLPLASLAVAVVLGLGAVVMFITTRSSSPEVIAAPAPHVVAEPPPQPSTGPTSVRHQTKVRIPPPAAQPPLPPVAPPALAPPPEPPPPPALEPPPPPSELTDDDSALLRITSTPPGARVFVDLRDTCKTPCVQRVTFGRHQVRLEHDGRAVDRSVQVLEDTVLDVSMVE